MSADAPTERASARSELRLAELESLVADRDELARLLVDAEQRLAEVPDLRRRIVELEREVVDNREAAEKARLEAQQLDQMLMYGRRALRYVRPAIKPLREARRRLRG